MFGLTGLVGFLVMLIVLVIIFSLLWWLISTLPLPATTPPFVRWALYAILVVIAIAVLLGLIPGAHLGG